MKNKIKIILLDWFIVLSSLCFFLYLDKLPNFLFLLVVYFHIIVEFFDFYISSKKMPKFIVYTFFGLEVFKIIIYMIALGFLI